MFLVFLTCFYILSFSIITKDFYFILFCEEFLPLQYTLDLLTLALHAVLLLQRKSILSCLVKNSTCVDYLTCYNIYYRLPYFLYILQPTEPSFYYIILYSIAVWICRSSDSIVEGRKALAEIQT